MRTLTIRLPDVVAAEIEAESRRRKISRSDVVSERLRAKRPPARLAASLDAIADLIRSVDGMPSDLGSAMKAYLRRTRYGRPAELHTRIVELVKRVQAAAPEGVAVGLADIARQLDPTVPHHAGTKNGIRGYRDHPTYYNLSYIMQCAHKRNRAGPI